MSAPAVEQIRLQIASSYASAMFITYEHLLTLDMEVKEMWNRKITAASVLFFVNRYSILFLNLVIILEQTEWNGLSDSSCNVMVRTEMILNAILGIAAAVYAAMRVHALFCRQRVLTGLTLFLGLISPVIITWIWAASVPTLINVPPTPECGVLLSVTNAQYVFLLLGSRVASLLADIIVVVLTVVMAYRNSRDAQLCGGSLTQRIMRIFIQSGVLYFMIMVVLNVVGIAIVGEIELDIIIPTWTLAITSIIISRFILELRAAYRDPLIGNLSLSVGTESSTSIAFASGSTLNSSY